MSNFIIRRLIGNEIPQTILLERSGQIISQDETSYRRFLADSSCFVFALIKFTKRHNRAFDTEVAGVCAGRLVLDELQIDSLVIRDDLSGCGFGQRLLHTVLEMGGAHGCSFAILEVRAENLPARRLYWKAGFTEVGLRRAYYHDPLDDAILMTLSLP